MSETAPSPAAHHRALPWLVGTAGVLALLTVIAWLAVPPIVHAQIESRLTAALGRPTTVEAVAFNPFRLQLTIRKLAVADGTGPATLFTVDALIADLSPASLWHRAPVLDALNIVRPHLSLARDRNRRYNVQDLIDQVLAAPPGPPRLSLNNIEIEDGSIAFDDAVTGRKHLLAALDVGIPFLSSLPHDTDIRVAPRMNGTFNGSRIALGGTTTPFAEHREASLDIDVDALSLPAYVAYLPAKPSFDLTAGVLTTKLKVVFIDGNPGERRLELRGDARIDGLALKRHDGSTLAAADRIAIALDRIEMLSHDARIAAVTIDAPVVEVKRLADGTLEWARQVAEAPSGTSPVAPPAAAWQLSMAKLAFRRGVITLVDETSTFRSTLADVTLDASNLSTRPGEKAHIKIDFVSGDRIASFSGEADVEPAVPAATGRFALSKFSLGLLFPYYKSALAVDVQKGSLDYASAFALSPGGNLTFAGGEAAINELRIALPGNREPLWRVPQITLHHVDADVQARKVVIGEAQGSGAALRLVREAGGTLEMEHLIQTTARTGTAADETTWTVLAHKLSLDRVAIDFEDRVPEVPVRLAVRELSATATDLTNARGGKSNVTLRARVGERGRFAFAGQVASNPPAISGDLDASELALVALRPYVEPRVNVVFTDGTLKARGRLAVEAPAGSAVRASWKGDLVITDFAALDKPTSSSLARWKSLALESADLATEPFRASVGRLALDDFQARLIVYPDGSLNVVRLMTPGAAPEPAADASPRPRDANADAALPISVDRIDIARGNVNFTDLFVRPNYSVNLTDVAGSVTTMSAERAGDLAITAKVDHIAPVEVQGRIHPFAKDLSLDLVGKARDVDLPPLTPYSGKYAGYGIEKGKLAFDVHYRVENRKLTAENHVVLDQLTFGGQVDSPSATKLPVLLAVALLKDGRGVIDLRLPISGSLDDPKFSVGGLIIQMIVNLIGKAATAPFALLGAVFGGGEELSTLTFAAGSAALGPDMRQRVESLGKALADRPGLKLDIGGHADPVADREALRRAEVETTLRRQKMKSLAAAGTAPATVDEVVIGVDERARWLAAAYREAPLPDRPRNVLGLLKELPPAEMEAMLYVNAKADDDALRALANARAEAVKHAIGSTGIADERLFLVAPRIGHAPGGAGGMAQVSSTKVELALR